MSLKEKWQRWKENYLFRQIERLQLPVFGDAPTKRFYFCFRGRVQNVGFRLEMSLLAKRLALSGWVRNTADGAVEAQVQGSEEKIAYLVSHMCSRKRLKVRQLEKREMALEKEDLLFVSDRE